MPLRPFGDASPWSHMNEFWVAQEGEKRGTDSPLIIAVGAADQLTPARGCRVLYMAEWDWPKTRKAAGG